MGGGLVLIGASTGGVEALSFLLSEFPIDCPPTLIVQHTGPAFGESLVRLLDARTHARVVAPVPGLLVTEGMICVAAGQRCHLRLKKGYPFTVSFEGGDPVSGHVPSVDALFSSGVQHASSVVACILTGMGSDGAQGLLKLKEAGARTFSQDEASSVVYGMPRVAWEMGASEKQLCISKLPGEILRACEEVISEKSV